MCLLEHDYKGRLQSAMSILGPVSGGDTTPWYPIIFGVGGLLYVWIRYAVVDRGRRPGPIVMGWATIVCLFLIYVGIRISFR